MSERRFVLADFTHMSTTECLRIYDAGNTYTMPRAVTHAAAKRVRPLTTPVAAGHHPAAGTGVWQNVGTPRTRPP